MQHLSNIFDDQEITSEKLLIYRSSHFISLDSKLQMNNSLGLKEKEISPLQVVPLSNRDVCLESDKENIRPSGLNSCSKRDINEAKNSLFKQHASNRKNPLGVNKCTPVWYQTDNISLFQDFEKLSYFKGRIQPLVETTNTGTDPLYFEEEAEAKVYNEKSMDTEDLIHNTSQAVGTDPQYFEAKMTDTTGLVNTQDQNVETGNEFIEKEKEEFANKRLKSYGQEISSRLSLIQFELNNLKDQQPRLKKEVCNLFENGENWSDFIHSRFQTYLTNKNADKKEKILALKSDLAHAKEEFNQVKAEVTDIIEKTKEEMTQSFQVHLETKLKQIQQSSNSYKASTLNMNKFSEFMMNENYSVSTESNFCSPSKLMAGTLIDQSFDSQTYLEPKKYSKKNPQKVDKAVIDGMLYLLQNGGLKDSITDVGGMTQAMEELLTKSKDKITTEMIFENLMDKTRKKQLNFAELADKKERRKSTRSKDPAPTKKVHVEEKEENVKQPRKSTRRSCIIDDNQFVRSNSQHLLRFQ